MMGEADNEANRTLWAGNLHENVTEELLYELFLQAGPLERVKLPKGKNYSFIVFQHEVSVPYTLELLDGVELFNRRIKLQFRSQPNANNQFGSPSPMSNSAKEMLDPHGFHRSFSAPSFPQGISPGQSAMMPGQYGAQGMNRMDTYPSHQRQSRFDQSPHNSGYNSPSYNDNDRRGRHHQGDDRRIERMQHDIQQQLATQLGNMSNPLRLQQMQRGQGHSQWQQGHRGYY